ncbi:MUT7 Exonuclease, partial [Machaerirhynchus nigripectus]|nr:MUT7 Exonuclease [Machaerirhynchus nigripectus]
GLPSLCQECPAWVGALGPQEVPGQRGAHCTDLPSLFSQVCNCNKYLKVSRERMRQLVEGSRRASGEHGAGEWVESQSRGVTAPARDTAQPGCAAHGGQAEQSGAAAVVAGDTVLQVAAIPPGVLDRAELTDFFCCTRCGKVFWEGSHFGRVVSQFQDVLVASGDTESIYELS